MKNKKIIDLRKLNLSYEDKKQEIRLLSFNTSSMILDIEIYENDTFIKKSDMVFAHLPKKLKVRLNPLKSKQ